MRIKKDPITRNEYISADGVWVRNFTKDCVVPINLSPLVALEEYSLLVENEESNRVLQISNISDEEIKFNRAVIVSDGYDFESRHRIISKFPSDVAVIAVNRALLKWKLMESDRKPINLYVVNNPYTECLNYMPKTKYYPACVASSRTNPNFVKKYKGRIYLYEPTPSRSFGLVNQPIYFIDDYRNPICAAIGLAHKFGVEKLMLMCCDDSFKEKRESSVELPNGLFAYNQHLITNNLIDANLYWYTRNEDITVADYSSGLKCKNAAYIKNEEEALSFFQIEE